MRLCNTAGTLNSELSYPTGVNVVDPLPRDKMELLQLSGVCISQMVFFHS